MIGSSVLLATFIAFALVMAALFAFSARRWVETLLWLGLTGMLGWSGLLNDFSLPPAILFLLLPALVAATWIGWKTDGFGLTLQALVGFQAFRILVELLIHQAVSEGVAPPQMTWDGMNLDIATGVTAALLFPFVKSSPRWVLHAWNVLGFLLLVNVLGVAALSMPTPFQQIHPDNTWIAHFPYVWLPCVHVVLAWGGHVALLRRLSRAPG